MKKIIAICGLTVLNIGYCFSQDEGFKYLGQAEPLDSPKVFLLPVNEGVPVERIATSSDDKEIYFTEINPEGNPIHIVKYSKYKGNIWDVFKVIINKQDTVSEPLGLNMKSKVQNDYYIDPDETFVLVSLNQTEIKCYGNKDIFIRFRTNGGWTKPINLGKKINTELPVTRFGICLSNDKKYMFYTQGNMSLGMRIYWVKVDELFKQLKENINNM
jgi:hypothetical protein